MFHGTCVTCNRRFSFEREEDAPFRPFCCKRCQLIDLGKWFNGEYVISDPVDPIRPAAADEAAADEGENAPMSGL